MKLYRVVAENKVTGIVYDLSFWFDYESASERLEHCKRLNANTLRQRDLWKYYISVCYTSDEPKP